MPLPRRQELHLRDALELTEAVMARRGSRAEEDARSTGHGCEIAFADEGVGITTEHQSRIFEEFEQAPSGDTVEGTGMGLSLGAPIRRAARGAGESGQCARQGIHVHR
ncbi:MAG TPA: ATP-binding protein [Thermoanaerobaculia bacterium]|nr:ATP-binding protein [Thermoanaerobaculia bacterium]